MEASNPLDKEEGELVAVYFIGAIHQDDLVIVP